MLNVQSCEISTNSDRDLISLKCLTFVLNNQKPCDPKEMSFSGWNQLRNGDIQSFILEHRLESEVMHDINKKMSQKPTFCNVIQFVD